VEGRGARSEVLALHLKYRSTQQNELKLPAFAFEVGVEEIVVSAFPAFAVEQTIAALSVDALLLWCASDKQYHFEVCGLDDVAVVRCQE